MEALSHPLRAAIIARLGEFSSQSAKGIAAGIGAPVRSVRHQLSRLVAEGVIEVSGSRRRRGAIEKLYRMPVGRYLESTDHELMGPEKSQRVVREIFRLTVADAIRSLVATGFERTASCEAWVAVEVDEAGWGEIARIVRGAYEAVEATRSRAAARLGGGSERAAYGISTLLCFERPRPAKRGERPHPEPPAGPREAALGVGGVIRQQRRGRVPVATLAEAMGHPIRMRILAALSRTDRRSVARIARDIREPPRRVRYHLGRLVADGLVARSPGGGRTRSLYALLATPYLDRDDLARLAPDRCRPVWAEVFRCVVGDAVTAISAGTFDRRFDFCQTRVPVTVDAQGRSEINAISLTTFERIKAAAARAEARLAQKESPPISATAAILWFEVPQP